MRKANWWVREIRRPTDITFLFVMSDIARSSLHCLVILKSTILWLIIVIIYIFQLCFDNHKKPTCAVVWTLPLHSMQINLPLNWAPTVNYTDLSLHESLNSTECDPTINNPVANNNIDNAKKTLISTGEEVSLVSGMWMRRRISSRTGRD